jgi:predicted house-cleaning noncanonical NTP pyrophosphatase (MazG superfamily)
MKEHNKLVRDRIPEIISNSGGTAQIRRIDSDNEYIHELIKKLLEEANEVAENPSIEELADVREVIDALLRALGFTEQELLAVQREKATKNGKFDDRLFLISTEN